ncbi:hypothetical protein RFI_02642, partial [Reticulomyxa filosa]
KLDFEKLQEMPPLFVPYLANPTDSRYFDDIEAEQDFVKKNTEDDSLYNGMDNRVWGYTFNRVEADDSRKATQNQNPSTEPEKPAFGIIHDDIIDENEEK